MFRIGSTLPTTWIESTSVTWSLSTSSFFRIASARLDYDKSVWWRRRKWRKDVLGPQLLQVGVFIIPSCFNPYSRLRCYVVRIRTETSRIEDTHGRGEAVGDEQGSYGPIPAICVVLGCLPPTCDVCVDFNAV